MIKLVLYFFLVLLCYSCATSHPHYSPYKKYPKEQLQEDYSLLRNILEKKHPSLYWYCSKDSMDMYFDKYYQSIGDSMTEQQFGWKVIAPLTEKIRCGHTSFGMSRAYNKWVRNRRFPQLPLYMKFWNDSMVLTANLNRKDTVLKKGILISSVNGLHYSELTQKMFGYMTKDGNADNVNYIRLSNNFPYYHRNLFGVSSHYKIGYLDAAGKEQFIQVPLYSAPKDSSKKTLPPKARVKQKKESRGQRLLAVRSLSIDTTTSTATLTVNNFTNGWLRKFFRRSFKTIDRFGVQNLVIDLRSNGGGRINLSTLLTRYITRTPFRVADSSFAKVKSLHPYSRYIKNGFWNDLGLMFLTHKKSDGNYHYGLWERKLYTPKPAHHYSGAVYVLTNGSTFSAAALMCNTLKGQPGILLVGEETGGGWYGNNGIMIPDITLPNTRLRVRLPLFRLVQYQHVQKDGRGIVPDLIIKPNYRALMNNVDKKMEVVNQLISNNKKVKE